MKNVSMSQRVSSGNTNNRDTKLGRNRCRRWCFTLNNYTKENIVSMSHDKWDNMKIKKYVFQEEIGKNKTAHLQGVVEFENQVDFSRLKKFNDKAHWSKCRDIKASIKYCSKEETRIDVEKIYKYGDVEKWLWKDKPMVEEISYDEMKKWDMKRFVKDCVEDLKGEKLMNLLPPDFQCIGDREEAINEYCKLE